MVQISARPKVSLSQTSRLFIDILYIAAVVIVRTINSRTKKERIIALLRGLSFPQQLESRNCACFLFHLYSAAELKNVVKNLSFDDFNMVSSSLVI